MAKVAFRDSDGYVETLWAFTLGDHLYRLDNSPFFAYDVSWQDVVEAQALFDGLLEFVRVVEKSGNRTLRLRFELPSVESEAAQKVLETLVSTGCSYEGSDTQYYSINVPAIIDLIQIGTYLTEVGIEWEHADPSYERLYPGNEQ